MANASDVTSSKAGCARVILTFGRFSRHFGANASDVWLRFWKADDFLTVLPLATLFQKLDPFEAL